VRVMDTRTGRCGLLDWLLRRLLNRCRLGRGDRRARDLRRNRGDRLCGLRHGVRGRQKAVIAAMPVALAG
jgi:hypothetical protein